MNILGVDWKGYECYDELIDIMGTKVIIDYEKLQDLKVLGDVDSEISEIQEQIKQIIKGE